jgi:glycosyltransferase involved in cell wall biosynthesis
MLGNWFLKSIVSNLKMQTKRSPLAIVFEKKVNFMYFANARSAVTSPVSTYLARSQVQQPEFTGHLQPMVQEMAASDRRPNQVDVSLVIPLLNEAESLPLLCAAVHEAMTPTDWSWDLILVDDGSTDASPAILRQLMEEYAHLRVLELRRNFGQTAAFTAGFDFSQGRIIVTMDADLQNDPHDIPLLLQKLEEGYDIVSGWRIDRQDKFLTRRLPSQAANWLISKVTGVRLHDYGCSLKAYRREVLEMTRLYGEMHRFIPALASQIGVRVAEVPVNHAPRRYGRSKYGLSRTIRVILDLMTVKFLLDYATRPIQIFGLLGLLTFVAGTALGGYLSILRLFFGVGLSDRPLLLLAVLLVVIGIQLLIMGLLGELIVRTYHEAQGKPIYYIRQILENESTRNE